MNKRLSLGNKLSFVKKNGGIISILFIHGNAVSSKIFLKQFSDPRLNDYTLWSIDLPGHGDSPKAENPSDVYSVKSMGKIVADFVKENINQPVVIVGSSLGGNIAIEAAEELDNVKGLFLCGTGPLASVDDIAKAFLPHPANAYSFKEEHTEEELIELYKLCVGDFTEYYELIKNDISRSDKLFRSTLLSTISNGLFSNEKEILRKMKIPVAIVHAGNENVVNLDYLKELEIPSLWKNNIQIIKNAYHFMHLTHSAYFNKLLKEFVETECK